jgi:hypothetical protein
VIALIAIPYSADHSKIDYSDLIKAPATSEPMEKAYRRWSDIENCIRDSNFDEAQKRLDEAVEEGLNGWNVYRLYSENYEAQGKYDDAAEAIIYYVYNVWGTENITKESLVYVRLEYLYPNCSEEVKVKIDEIMSL